MSLKSKIENDYENSLKLKDKIEIWRNEAKQLIASKGDAIISGLDALTGLQTGFLGVDIPEKKYLEKIYKNKFGYRKFA